jgi:hypothetical protein
MSYRKTKHMHMVSSWQAVKPSKCSDLSKIRDRLVSSNNKLTGLHKIFMKNKKFEIMNMNLMHWLTKKHYHKGAPEESQKPLMNYNNIMSG